MMAIATGVGKKVRYKKETTWGTAPGQTGGKELRRLQSNLNLNKATFRSNEIRADMQRADFRHGARSVEGTLSGELSVGTWNDFLASAVRGTFGTAATTGAAAASTYGFTTDGPNRSSGSFLTNGFKVGDIIRCTGYATASLNNRNFLVTDVAATQLTGFFIDGTANSAETSSTTASVSITVTGKKVFTPESGQTNDSYSLEHWFSDIAQSELFLGCKISQAAINLPASGMAEAEFTFMGKDMADVTTKRGGVALTAAYFTSPSAASTGTSLAAVNGALVVGGVKYATITGMNFTVNGNHSAGEVIGSTTTPDIFQGSIDVSGQLTCYFEDATLRDLFTQETEAAITVVMTDSNAADAGFVAFTLPRVKVGGNSKDDGEQGLVQTVPFTALLQTAGGSGNKFDKTTLIVQDSAAV
jgi:hypothetical protein